MDETRWSGNEKRGIEWDDVAVWWWHTFEEVSVGMCLCEGVE